MIRAMNRFATPTTRPHSDAAQRPAQDRLHQPVGEVVPGRGQQDQEAPEDERMRETRAQVVEEAALADDVDHDALQALERPIRAIQRPAAAQDGEVLAQPAPEEHTDTATGSTMSG